jgi:GT2 family glycosyltransferase
LERVGTMDESLFHYFSDVDWARRFWENGYTVVYYPMAAMAHYHGRTSKGHLGILDAIFNRATRWHIKDAIRYFWKHGIAGTRPAPTT